MKILKISGIIDFTMSAYYKTITRNQAEAILLNVKLHKGLLGVRHTLVYENGSYYFNFEDGQVLNIVQDYDKTSALVQRFTLSPLGFIQYDPQLKLFSE